MSVAQISTCIAERLHNPHEKGQHLRARAALQAEASAACQHATDAIDKLQQEVKRAREAEAATKAAADRAEDEAAVLCERQEQQAQHRQELFQRELVQATQAAEDAVAAAAQQSERLAQEQRLVKEGRDAVSCLEAQLAAERSSKADIEAQLAAERSAKADVEAELAAALSAKAEVQAAASAVDVELAAACKTTAALQAQLQELQQQHGVLQTQKEGQQQQHVGLQVQLQEMHQQRVGLQTQIEKQQQQLQEAAAAAALLARGQQTEKREVLVQTQSSLQDACTGPGTAPGSWQHVGSQTEACIGLPEVASASCQDVDCQTEPHDNCQTEWHAHISGDSTAQPTQDEAGHVLLEAVQLWQVAGAVSAGDCCCSRPAEAQTQTDSPASAHPSAGDSCCSRLAAAQTQTDLPAPEQKTGQGQTVSAGTQSEAGCSVVEVSMQAQPSTLDAATGTDAAIVTAGLEAGCQTDMVMQVVEPQRSTTSQTDPQAPCSEDDAADQQQQQDTVAAAAASTTDDSPSAESRVGTAAAENSQAEVQVNTLQQCSYCHQPGMGRFPGATTLSASE